ncbi:ABC transporter substrate-binding protein [Brooklawnia cerclae]|uniref:Iron complex transport system substrate-binding protein n=1 Tax=Brooklawnia cerclae TaxID=349934 RepID=A0ABX0SIU5_9ACTN|nr:ABC transporter substrate-binding protein [Brooklawnia cerclae]NIH56561.1 iron complex transport system substrate-binding protein [Brooklawnia cerclae]
MPRRLSFTRLVLLVTLVVTALVTGCSQPSASPSVAATRSVTDVLGNVVEIPTTVTRIVTAYPAVDQIFLLLGAQDKVVALNKNNTTNDLLLTLAPEYADLPVVFDSSSNFDTEALLAVNPDVVIAGSQEVADAVQQVGIPAVVAMSTSPDTLKQTITLIGDILGATDRAEEFIAYYDDNMAQATQRTESLTDAERTRVYYATGTGPLNTEAKGSIVTDWIEMAGGTNVATDAGVEGMFVDISAEQLFSWDPEVIICTSAQSCAQFLDDDVYADLTAVKNKAVYPSPSGAYTWSVRSAEEATMTLWAATKIQPDLFTDVDYVQITKDFYEQFYGYALTDEQTEAILEPSA